MFNLNTTGVLDKNVQVTVAGQVFTLHLRRPTGQERIDDDGTAIELRMKSGDAFAAAYRRRFYARLNCVVGWSEVQDAAGQSVEFTRELLVTLLNRFPELLDQVNDGLHALYDLNETAVGEPDGKPAESPTGNPDKQTPS